MITLDIFEIDCNIYRELVYRAGGIAKENQGSISLEKIEKEISQDFELPKAEIFKHRVRYFTDGAVIGSKGFIKYAYNQFGGRVIKKKDRNAHKTNIGSDIFSLRCLRV